MTFTRSLTDGVKIAFYAGLQLAIVNGLWARFSPSGNSLSTAIESRLGVSSNGGMV